MSISLIGTSNQLFIVLSLKLKQIFKKSSYWQISVLCDRLTTLFVLTLVSDMTVLYRNDACSILMLSTKKGYSSFFRKKLKTYKLKPFKISTDCYIKRCRSLKRRAILKIPSTVF